MATTTSTKTTTGQVRVRLRTDNEDIQLPADIGAILVSAELRRYQLSTLVNRLLKTERPIPLEFLVNGQFLRTTLDEYLTQNGISAETTLNVEYVRALVPPLPVASYPHDDWVSSLDVLTSSSRAVTWQSASPSSRQSRILSGSFDGNLRVWDSSNNVIATGSAHVGPVKHVKFITPDRAVSAGMDRTLRVWEYTDATEPSPSANLSPILELYGHTASVDHLAVHGPSSRILSASADHSIGVWSITKSALPPAPENLLPGSVTGNKRRKLSHSTKPISQRGPSSLLQGHSAQVAAVCFDEKDSTVGYSASWDHSVKTWDLTTSACVDTRTTSQSLYSLAHLPELSLLAAGTSARHVTLIDPRVSATTVSAMTLKGHTNSISSIAQDPVTAYQIVSGSHDGTCRIWDLRSGRNDIDGKTAEAVYVIERESAKGQVKRAAGDGIKVFDVVWNSEIGIASAGEDKMIQINKSA
ncbi:hypothetical protein AMS68_006436 [Peltaster fructicola]|uniref:Ribosome biogenesis protein YTM1 n=1 Tax=Peltaster fructicola TaxID=286661 RepID=A0A6H0Y217_9PEZI|nr:hypothetical protein AMS68_006436 [Peltaster fructicola]